ncbi:MAG: nicotinate-nucleotide--dimethylbenzimidazole phosphoribosyltransferase [Firmicutes bacterium]|nr:nicotinate-nucleotide--dimethylbenzimidazole phosphoribosyltransferase [Bacillota bacterium]
MRLLERTLAEIGKPDGSAIAAARKRLDNLTKPLGSLGVLEDLAAKLAGISGKTVPPAGWPVDKAVVVMAGDHGVTAEGVSAYPQEVTVQMIANFVRGGAGINVLARQAGARVVVVDMGVAGEVADPAVLSRKIRPGTRNIAAGPAMDREDAVAALEAGIAVASAEVEKGAALLATGDMGIGNTTPSSAITAAFAGMPVQTLVGSGTGIDGERRRDKVAVVERALAANSPDPRDGIAVLAALGGFEIGGLAGLILGAAARRVPIIIDGFIAGAAALVAARIKREATSFMIASHLSEEPGHRICLELLGLEPVLRLRMRLGEGTGAVLAMNLVEASARIIREMATFGEAGVSTAIEG